MNTLNPRWAVLSLVIVTMIWGGTFLVVHTAVQSAGPLAFVGTRFAIAALIAAVLSRKHLRGFTALELGAGLAIGASIFAGYSLQTQGLQYITSSKSAFITAFYVPMVPLLQWLFQRQRPHIAALAGAALSFAGLACLAGPEGIRGGLGYGELLTALGALAISAEIILIGHYSQRVNLARVTVTQLAVASLLAFAAMPVAGESLPGYAPLFLVCALALGAASAAIQYVMNWAQRQVSATKATLIYAGEPVWAGLFGLLAGEHIPMLAVLGAAMIVSASVIGETSALSKQEQTSN
ncbi:EamA family transporter [Duganella sp. FT80W]|uniref:EamA family transporter n=1 Tax=Duganella guangzhouensis TaxID=2666084 RepID=A0A6I2L5P6_9BURK|nr:DMT family transporter [Duganella guangzhouensis]MRW93471.1 EamA family transporter [Duganella guangzhouensis]